MHSRVRIFVAASVTIAALGLGCQSVPESDAPGGVLSGNDFALNRAARGTSLDRTATGPGGGSSIDASHSTAGPTGSGGTTASGTAAGSVAAPSASGAVAAPGSAG